MPAFADGPVSPAFAAVELRGNATFEQLGEAGLSPEMTWALGHAPQGECVCWGLPFSIGCPVLVADGPVTVEVGGLRAQWLVFQHTSDLRTHDAGQAEDGLLRGMGRLGEIAARYVIIYADATELALPIQRRHQIGMVQRSWGENCLQAVAHRKPATVAANHERPTTGWGSSQFRNDPRDSGAWVNWLWAWENPHPTKIIAAIRFEPVSGRVIVSGLCAGKASGNPLRWRTRQKAVLTLPRGEAPQTVVGESGEFTRSGEAAQIGLDLGQVIRVQRRPIYPQERWPETDNNTPPGFAEGEALVEYTAHPDARFHIPGRSAIPVARLEKAEKAGPLRVVTPETQRVKLRVTEKGSGTPVPVKLHLHGEAGEYLAPLDRFRVPNPCWLEEFGVDFLSQGSHWCTYINGETVVDLPVGRVYLEVSKGFEIRPVRKVLQVTGKTKEITVEIERVLPWRERGWVSADTHVHFLSPTSALLEGAGEGVNVVNLLATRWGELVTNVGDFDWQAAHGAAGGASGGEHLVRVGTENRQHVLGHISLVGYEGPVILPLTTGGPDESALGDAIECLLTEWAAQCQEQRGIVVLPHFPNPRSEHAASIVSGVIDAVEMTSWGDLYSGISPYSLADWYRYLNCGYKVAAVGGTDKMSAETAVGAVRTYAQIAEGEAFTYDAWKEAVRAGRTFVTYGPLLEWQLDGHLPGESIGMAKGGGTVDVTWNAASVTIPMSRIELIVNGEIRESRALEPGAASGQWSVRLEASSWVALLIRGHYADRPEIIAAHSSPIMVDVAGSRVLPAADAMTILDQIEGALAYLDTVGTRAETKAYKRMRLVLTSAHRSLHNRMHKAGAYHDHTPVTDYPEHH